ncbi:hypothetical protein Q5M85_07740 [Paraclostridium bifermentans]|nr:hypothetical protein [Paraclostridium bifermentans]
MKNICHISNCCGHNDCRPCVEYIPCFGPAGPVGSTATNQFLSLGFKFCSNSCYTNTNNF